MSKVQACFQDWSALPSRWTAGFESPHGLGPTFDSYVDGGAGCSSSRGPVVYNRRSALNADPECESQDMRDISELLAKQMSWRYVVS